MPKFPVPAIVALLLLAGCSSSNAPSNAPAAAATIANAVTGTVMLREPRQLTAQANLYLQVVDVAQPDVVLAQATVAPANQPPIAFRLPIDPAKVDGKRTYAVVAVLHDGDRRFTAALQYPVLTHGASARADVIVAPEPTPAEKIYEDYTKLMRNIGGMRQVSGTQLGDDTSVGWDGFLEGGKVRVVREITDLGDKGRVNIKFAYQNEKPWVVVKEEVPAGASRPAVTIRVGWNDGGQLVLHEKIANGLNVEVTADEAKNLYTHAEQARRTALAAKR